MDEHDFDPDAVELPSGHLIGGRRVIGDGTEFEVRRPSDGRLARRERGAGPALVDRAVTTAKAAWRTSGWAAGEPRDRQRVMRRWADLVDEHLVELARLECVVSVRTITPVLARDVRMAAEVIRFYGEAIDKVEGSILAAGSGKYSLMVHEPYGVVAAIAPWNTPLLLATLKIAPAVAAGNAVVLKPSELTPYSILRIAELGEAAGLPTGLLSVIPGPGPETGAALVRHPDVGYVSFTGSGTTGQRVMCDAATSGLKPVSLELGGKSPQLVFGDAPDLDAVADIVAGSVCANAGQVCFAGTRLVVERTVRDLLLDKVAARMDAVRPGATWHGATTLAPIVNERQARRLDSLLRQAVEEGASVSRGGGRLDAHPGGIFFAPTILRELAPENTAVREELFGPVLTVQCFDTEEEGLALADHPTFGLAAGVHTRDLGRALRASRALQAGTVWINHFGPNTQPNAPMGGFKQSGFGKDYGMPGMEKFLRTKNVAIRH